GCRLPREIPLPERLRPANKSELPTDFVRLPAPILAQPPDGANRWRTRNALALLLSQQYPVHFGERETRSIRKEREGSVPPVGAYRRTAPFWPFEVDFWPICSVLRVFHAIF